MRRKAREEGIAVVVVMIEEVDVRIIMSTRSVNFVFLPTWARSEVQQTRMQWKDCDRKVTDCLGGEAGESGDESLII